MLLLELQLYSNLDMHMHLSKLLSQPKDKIKWIYAWWKWFLASNISDKYKFKSHIYDHKEIDRIPGWYQNEALLHNFSNQRHGLRHWQWMLTIEAVILSEHSILNPYLLFFDLLNLLRVNIGLRRILMNIPFWIDPFILQCRSTAPLTFLTSYYVSLIAQYLWEASCNILLLI